MASRPPRNRPTDDVARNRWMVMQAMRIMGFALVIVGLLLTRDVMNWAGDANHILGYALVLIGLADGFFVPIVLARKWRTPRQ
ncbi:hypothetical protein [Croceibacterium aestuarii]|uniref:hypothetical protein n=1 Tax=Croceibacterium aestuarii TaxID=3064139 RepID=UPI00272DC957|nr:hypothetical protein [Croceibacterium sp. D39]